MGILNWFFGTDSDAVARQEQPPPPLPSKAGAGPDIDSGRLKTQTEKDLRRVQARYNPDKDRFDPEN
jgi:hypothetical protein